MSLHESITDARGVSQSETRRLSTTPTACCLARTFYECFCLFSLFLLFFLVLPFHIFLLLEEHLGDLGLYICATDLLVMAGDLAGELKLPLACFVDQLIDGAL